MVSKKNQKTNEKKKYREPSIKEIGKINSVTFGVGVKNPDSGTGTSGTVS